MYQKVFELHADLLKALSHPKRLEIVQLLRNQSLSVSQIEIMLGLPQANLSQHLMVLRQAGVVNDQKKGKQVYYKVAHKNFTKACDLMRQILIERHRGDKLADELSFNMLDLVPIVIDPICGMRLSPKTAAYAVRNNDATYYFCAAGCKKTYEKRKNL